MDPNAAVENFRDALEELEKAIEERDEAECLEEHDENLEYLHYDAMAALDALGGWTGFPPDNPITKDEMNRFRSVSDIVGMLTGVL